VAIDFQPKIARTRDGVSFTIRALRPDDFALEDEFIRSLSETSRYFRLMYALKEPSVSFVQHMVGIDGVASMALAGVVQTGKQPHFIAVARYGRNPDGHSAEFAIAVADAWQKRGVASQLLQELADYAHAHGIDRFEGQVLATNYGMIDLCRWLKFDLRRSPEAGNVLIATRKL
jgi:acetyltransferase